MLGIAGCAVFLVLTAAVQARWLAGLDLAIASGTRALVSAPLDALAAALSIAFSGELSLVYALAASLLLWRQGLGRWSLAPLAFLLLVPVEVGLKSVIQQPPVPGEFYRAVYYPLGNVQLSGSFPSGHAMRGGFLCTFLAAALLRSGNGVVARVGPWGLALLAMLVGFSRIYLGYHWLSDVVAGLVLGAALALLVAAPDRL